MPRPACLVTPSQVGQSAATSSVSSTEAVAKPLAVANSTGKLCPTVLDVYRVYTGRGSTTRALAALASHVAAHRAHMEQRPGILHGCAGVTAGHTYAEANLTPRVAPEDTHVENIVSVTEGVLVETAYPADSEMKRYIPLLTLADLPFCAALLLHKMSSTVCRLMRAGL